MKHALIVVLMATAGLSQSKPTAASSAPTSRPAATGAAAFAPLFKFCPAQIESLMCVVSPPTIARSEAAESRGTDDDDDMKTELPGSLRTLTAGSKLMWRGVERPGSRS